MLTARARTSRNGQDTLQNLVGNLTLLQIKAKNYHWNVSGESFYGDHHTFDGLADLVEDWIDTIAERMRALQQPVNASAAFYLENLWFTEGDYELDRDEMVEGMVSTLETVSTHLYTMIRDEENPVTQNILQDLCANLEKQAYFLRSSL